jgi:hypothetical protein
MTAEPSTKIPVIMTQMRTFRLDHGRQDMIDVDLW